MRTPSLPAQEGSSVSWGQMIMLAITLLGILLTITSFGPAFNYSRFTWGLLLLWLTALWVRELIDRFLDDRAPAEAPRRRNPLLRLPVNILLTLAPGLILMWFGFFGPAEPTLTQGGFDVCELSVGYCVSGTRAFIYFGGFVLLIGLIIISFQINSVRQALRNEQ